GFADRPTQSRQSLLRFSVASCRAFYCSRILSFGQRKLGNLSTRLLRFRSRLRQRQFFSIKGVLEVWRASILGFISEITKLAPSFIKPLLKPLSNRGYLNFQSWSA